MNTQTGRMLSLDQAADLHILDPVHGVFTDLKAKTKMLIGDAVDQKLVEIEYDKAATGKLIEVDEILFRVWRRLSATQTLLQLLIHTT